MLLLCLLWFDMKDGKVNILGGLCSFQKIRVTKREGNFFAISVSCIMRETCYVLQKEELLVTAERSYGFDHFLM